MQGLTRIAESRTMNRGAKIFMAYNLGLFTYENLFFASFAEHCIILFMGSAQSKTRTVPKGVSVITLKGCLKWQQKP